MASKLQSELKKQQPFETPEKEALLNLLRTADEFNNRLGRLFREFELTPSQYNVLRILRGSETPLPALEVADRMIQVVPAITGLVDRLETAGLVERKRSTEDRRVILLSITAKARRQLSKIDGPLAQLESELLGHLSGSELKKLTQLLEKARS